MVRECLRNFVRYIKFLALIAGFFAVAVGIAAAVFYFGVSMPLEKISPAAHKEFFDVLYKSVTSIDIRTTFSAQTLRAILKALIATLDNVPRSNKILIVIATAIAFAAIFGLLELGEWLAKRRIRKDIETNTSVRGVLATVIRLALSAAAAVAYVIITYMWFFAVFLLPVLKLAIDTLKDLVSAYFVYFRDEKLKVVLNAKNIFRLLGTKALIMLISYILLSVILLLCNIWIAIIVAMPLLTYNSAVTSLTGPKYLRALEETGRLD